MVGLIIVEILLLQILFFAVSNWNSFHFQIIFEHVIGPGHISTAMPFAIWILYNLFYFEV